ncbi:hypothetical protein AMECASPLE_026334 [Ameca splendens]|uniref:Uncharacterized protein n=1 Tax=Ameca splendens TaxID=208324 RepID=A0ABV0Z2T6_9TELE
MAEAAGSNMMASHWQHPSMYSSHIVVRVCEKRSVKGVFHYRNVHNCHPWPKRKLPSDLFPCIAVCNSFVWLSSRELLESCLEGMGHPNICGTCCGHYSVNIMSSFKNKWQDMGAVFLSVIFRFIYTLQHVFVHI